MAVQKYQHAALIGCGMMGGSFALAAKRAGLVERIVGYSKSPSNSEYAKKIGAIDSTAPSILQAVTGADLVLIAVPVAAIGSVLKAMQYGLNSDALVMDVGSTKQSVVADAEKVFGTMPPNFVPAHPIAGQERATIVHATADLFKGHRLILTPTDTTDPVYVRRAIKLWQSLGMKVTSMTAEDHDATYACVSHLPHLMAFAFMNALGAQPHCAELLAMAGPGFRDFTRIAASDPEVWCDILLANRKQVLKQSGAMLMALSQLEYAIRDGNPQELTELITRASDLRFNWSHAKHSEVAP
jgi:prephenate dehydrogenase